MNIFGVEHHAAKAFRDGTDRVRTPQETLNANIPKMRSFGITRLADVTGLDSIGIPVYVCVRPNSRSLSTAQGKGLTHEAAKASALMESIESWHAERINRPLVFECARVLRRSRRVIDLSTMALSRGTAFEETTPILWMEGWDVLASEPILVPYDAVSLNFSASGGYRSTFLRTSNGLASGNHVLEAVAHGLLEVVERDAQALFERLPDALETRRVDLRTVDDPGCVEVLTKLERAGVLSAAWDMTNDIGIPAFACQIYESPERAVWRPLGACFGYGCHLSPGIALLRALTEAAQSRLTLISGTRDDSFDKTYFEFADREMIRQYWAATEATQATVSFKRHPDMSKATFEEDLQVICDRLRGAGIQSVVVVDLAKPEIGIPVVKVRVPGVDEDGKNLRFVGPLPERLRGRS